MDIYKPSELLQHLAEQPEFLQCIKASPAYLCGLTESIILDSICAHKDNIFTVSFEKKEPLKLTASALLNYLSEQSYCEMKAANIVKTYNLLTATNKARTWIHTEYAYGRKEQPYITIDEKP